MVRPNVLLAGCGKMGGAMLRRWQELSLYKDVCIIEPAPIKVLAAKQVPDFSQVPKGFAPDVVVFAVKPQTLPDMIEDYAVYAENDALFVSIVAGKPIEFFEDNLGREAAVVRCMPNTPAAIGEGITVACPNYHVTDAQKEQAESLIGAVGEMLWVEEEELLNPVTALSGSGPAYVFLLMEVMAEAGKKIGLEPKMAEKLARQTVIGSAALAAQSKRQSPARLRQNVTSPGGTTAAALEVLMGDEGIQKIFDKALKAAKERAEELSR